MLRQEEVGADVQAPLDADDASPALTIVVPTRNEAGNVAELARRLDEALSTTEAEIIFVDDSDDDTPAAVERLAEESSRPIRLIHRANGTRAGGLGGAVLAG